MYLIPALLSAMPAMAASPIAEVICAPSHEMATRLKLQMGEAKVATGLRSPEEMMEMWSSSQSGNWTLVMTYASGESCIVAMGEHFLDTRPQDPA